MFQFRRVATHTGPAGSVPHVLADAVHHMREVSDLDVQLWHLVAGGPTGTSMISVWAPRVEDVTELLDGLRGDRIARDLRDEATAMLHGPERDTFETVLAGEPQRVRSRPGWVQVRSEAVAALRPGTWMTDPVEAAAQCGVHTLAVREMFGDENRVAWISIARDHGEIVERSALLTADVGWATADAAVDRHLTATGRSSSLWRRSV